MYYLTQYNVTGLASTKNPIVKATIDKHVYLIEELKLVVYDSNGDIVQEELETFDTTKEGRTTSNFIISVPLPGTYSYNVQSKRYYPLINGSEISTENSTMAITFTIDKTTFYSPYNTRRS